MKWTSEQDRQMLQLMERGLSSGQVAECLGRTRSMVIAHARRKNYLWSHKRGGSRPRFRPSLPPPLVEEAPPKVLPESADSKIKYQQYKEAKEFRAMDRGDQRRRLDSILAEAVANTRKLQDAMEEDVES